MKFNNIFHLLYVAIAVLNIFFVEAHSETIVTNHVSHQLGDNIALFSIAYILSQQYSLTFIYCPFKYSHLFVFDDLKNDRQCNYTQNKKNSVEMHSYQVCKDANRNSVIDFHYDTEIGPVEPYHLASLKALVQFKNPPVINHIPKDKITIAVHIRKGNGGGEHSDGSLLSQQQYNINTLTSTYIYDYINFPFEWEIPVRCFHETYAPEWIRYLGDQYEKYPSGTPLDKIDLWRTKFPPEQYYIDQLKKIIAELPSSTQYYVQIFTDDKDPKALYNRIVHAIAQENIQFYYHDHKNMSFEKRITYDLYTMSQFDILIRSQSYFARAAELIGNHKIVIHPLTGIWIDGVLFMNYVAIKGSLSSLQKNLLNRQ